MSEDLSSTLEDYLEAILRLEQKKGAARVRDIAQQVGVAKSTVTAALRSLADKELVEYEPYELVGLTSRGRRKALAIVTNHHIISHFLQHILLLDRDRAERIACEVEHAVDEETMGRFVCFLAFVERSSAGDTDLLAEFRRFLCEETGERSCKRLVEDYRKTIEPEIGVK